MVYTSEEDDVSSDEPHPISIAKTRPVDLQTQINKPSADLTLGTRTGGRLPAATTAGAAVAVLGAGYALTKLLRRRLAHRGGKVQPKGTIIIYTTSA
jgi:hypothetical protein